MIESNNLRIGNLVHSDFSETNIKTVVEIKHKMASVKYIRTDTNEPHQSMVDYERLIPIELTREWLLKAGFEGHSTNPYWFRKNDILISENGNLELVSWDRNIFKLNKSIKYVHELQNIFFSLFGEELVFSSTEP